MALAHSEIEVELREISLKMRPEELYAISSKGTVPVLQLKDETIIDESLDIMMWTLKQKQSEWVFVSNELTVQIEKTHYQYSKLKKNKVTFGIRPEDIHDSSFAEIKDDRNTIDAKVEFTEYLGSEMNVHLSAESNSFTARFNRKINMGSIDSISVILDVNKGHFFDARNGNIL